MNIKNILSKKSVKIGIFVFFGILVISLVSYVLILSSLSSKTSQLATSTNISQDLENWASFVKMIKIIPDSKNSAFNKISTLNAIDGYMKSYENINKYSLIKLPKMELANYSEKQKVTKGSEAGNDDKFIADQKYSGNLGVFAFDRVSTFKLKINDVESQEISAIIYQSEINDFNSKITGTLPLDKAKSKIYDNFNELVTNVYNQDITKAKEFIADTNPESVIKQIESINDIKSKINSLKIVAFNVNVNDNEDQLSVGLLIFSQTGSSFTSDIKVVYDKEKKTYKFTNPFENFALIPVPGNVAGVSTTQSDTIINCTDCSLAPVDKSNALPSSYAPRVENISLAGGGQLTSQAYSALSSLFNDAASNGITITVISAYRSYLSQISTFNYWVDAQKQKGLSQSQAEIEANKISAKPGHSEHQLGTVVDLKCSTCGNFDNSTKNLELYKYLETNAYKYGFVISYPKGKDSLTGYSYEPWHIRYIGVELAKLFYDKGYLTAPNLWSTKLLSEL